jgi:uncharacterized membrane protein YbhN (UPF0104 family)
MKVTIVLPAYNEAKKIEKAVEEVKRWMDETGYDYEIIIAEDGSTDGTDKIASKLAKNDPKVRHLHSDKRLGRGKALSNAFKLAEGDVLVYLDVDLSTDMKHLKELIDAIAVEGYDLATGSRLMKESQADRPFKRDFASRVYNFLVRFMLGSKLKDHQCGFKAFRKDAILKIMENVKDNHWFWDTEVLVLAQRMGYKVKEIPIRWKQSGDTKVRFTKDVLYMFSQILRMWMESKHSKKFFLFSVALSIAILIGVAWFVGFDITALTKADLKLIALASAIYLLSFIVRGYRYEYILSKLNYEIPLIFSAEGVAVSQMANVITPARVGDLARVYVFKLKDVPVSVSLSGLTVERVFDLFSVILLAFISIISMNSFKLITTPLYAVILLAFIVLLIFALARMENIVGKIFKDAGRAIKRGFVVTTAVSLVIWLIDILVCYIILLAFGFSNVAIATLAVSISNIVKAIPITPGGIGTYEAMMTGILSMGGISPDLAFTVGLIDHAIKNLITVALGCISLVSLNLKLRDIT